MAQLKVLRPLSEGPKRDLFKKVCNLGKIFRSIIWVLAVASIALLVVLPANTFTVSIKGADEETVIFEKEYQISSLDTMLFAFPKIGELVADMSNGEDDGAELSLEEEVLALKQKSFSAGERVFNMGLNVSLVDKNVEDTGSSYYDSIILTSNAKAIETFSQDVEVNNIRGINRVLSIVYSQLMSNAGNLGAVTTEQQVIAIAKASINPTVLDNAMSTYLVGEYEKTDAFYLGLATGCYSPLYDIDADTSDSGSSSGDTSMDSMLENMPEFAYMFTSSYLILLVFALLEIILLIVPVIRLIIYLITYIMLLCGYKRTLCTSTIGTMIVIVPALILVLGIIASMASFLASTAVFTACTISTINVFCICAFVCALAARIVQIIYNVKIRRLNRELQK